MIRWRSYDVSPEGKRTEYDERKAERLWRHGVDKAEYPDFESWLFDMERCGILARLHVAER